MLWILEWIRGLWLWLVYKIADGAKAGVEISQGARWSLIADSVHISTEFTVKGQFKFSITRRSKKTRLALLLRIL